MAQSTATGRRLVTMIGTVVVAAPLVAGLTAALLSLVTGFGGPRSATTLLWYVPAVWASVATLGALILVVAQFGTRHRGRLLGWTILAATGWVFGIGAAQAAGLTREVQPAHSWQLAMLGIGVATYLVGLVGLTWAGWTAARPEAGPAVASAEDGRRVSVHLCLAVAALYVAVFAVQVSHLAEPDTPAPVYLMLTFAYLAGAAALTWIEGRAVHLIGLAVQAVVLVTFAVVLLRLTPDELDRVLGMGLLAGAIVLAQFLLIAALAWQLVRDQQPSRPTPAAVS